MSVVWECCKCDKKTFGTYDGDVWHPVKKSACACDAPYVPLHVCDWCGGRVYSSFNESDGDWRAPNLMWREFSMDDWQIHGCSSDCWEEVMTRATSEKPRTTTSTVALSWPVKKSEASSADDVLLQSHDSSREDDRTPSDSFALL